MSMQRQTSYFSFTAIWTTIVRVTLSSISLQNNTLFCSNLYFSLFRIIHCNTETFKSHNHDHLQQLIMDAIMQNPFNSQSAADHFRH